jgi:hypothetical protein
MKNYENLVEAIQDLKSQGYVDDLSLSHDCIECKDRQLKMYRDEFEIDGIYRFDANTDPDDESILYTVSSEKHDVKGLLINSYGIYSDESTNDLLDAIKSKASLKK